MKDGASFVLPVTLVFTEKDEIIHSCKSDRVPGVGEIFFAGELCMTVKSVETDLNQAIVVLKTDSKRSVLQDREKMVELLKRLQK